MVSCQGKPAVHAPGDKKNSKVLCPLDGGRFPSRDLCRHLELGVGAGRGSPASLQAKPSTPSVTPHLTRAPPIMCAVEHSRRGEEEAGRQGPPGRELSPDPSQPVPPPSLPHSVFQKFKSAQNQENKSITAHFEVRFPSYLLIYWLLESKSYKWVSVKDLFLASLYSYLCSHKNPEATSCALGPGPPPPDTWGRPFCVICTPAGTGAGPAPKRPVQ